MIELLIISDMITFYRKVHKFQYTLPGKNRSKKMKLTKKTTFKAFHSFCESNSIKSHDTNLLSLYIKKRFDFIQKLQYKSHLKRDTVTRYVKAIFLNTSLINMNTNTKAIISKNLKNASAKLLNKHLLEIHTYAKK
jgi:hypothetical protein